MTPAEILDSVFPAGHDLATEGDLLFGRAKFGDGIVHVVGATGRAPIGIDQAIRLSAAVLAIASTDDGAPILFLVDSASQRMSRRDELLGLSEYLAHLAKSLLLAEARGHRTIGLLYGGSAAGAFIATALACGTLVALPGAHPEVMDLASMARVTKLPEAMLTALSESNPVFAPGVGNYVAMGGVRALWEGDLPAALREALAGTPTEDLRARDGAERGGRRLAAEAHGPHPHGPGQGKHRG